MHARSIPRYVPAASAALASACMLAGSLLAGPPALAAPQTPPTASQTAPPPSIPVAKVPTNRPDIGAFETPPLGFDPVTASAVDLARYGVPPRPDTAAPAARSEWEQVVRKARQYVVPHFTARPGVHHNATTPNWAGTVVTNPQAWAPTLFPAETGWNYVTVHGSWQIPDVSALSPYGNSSVWVGLDGYSSGAGRGLVEQMGTEEDTLGCSINWRTGQLDCPPTLYSAWFEMYPDPEQTVDSVHLYPGDSISTWAICSASGSGLPGFLGSWLGANRLWFSMFDSTRGWYTSFVVNAKYGCPGDSAEWIVERPTIDSAYTWLNAFRQVTLTSMTYSDGFGALHNANDTNPYALILFNRTTVLDMVASDGRPLATTTSLGPTSDQVTWVSFV